MRVEENLVGYLLDALDPETKRGVETYVRSHPEAQRQLDLLRQALEPLASDRDTIEPPPGLRVRTVARLAEYRCGEGDRVPPAPPVRSVLPMRSWWRRADVAVAAAVLFIALPALLVGLTYARHRSALTVCQGNLRQVFGAVSAYADLHNGALPMVEAQPPHNFGAMGLSALGKEGLLQNVSLRCPGNPAAPARPVNLDELEQEFLHNPEKFEEHVNRLAGCYAYTLGYRDKAGHHGLRRDPDDSVNSMIPIMADRPPFDRQTLVIVPADNSLNHGGYGQNVLHLGGHVVFYTKRNVGVNGDDIYTNQKNRIEAGVDRFDAVLGASAFRPYPFGLPNN